MASTLRAAGCTPGRAAWALRTPVVGRKNFYGSWSVASAELAARAWTITATAAQAGLNPLTYLALKQARFGAEGAVVRRKWPDDL